MLTILAVVLLIFIVAGSPAIGWAPQSFGYYPSGLGVLLLLVVLWMLFRGRV